LKGVDAGEAQELGEKRANCVAKGQNCRRQKINIFNGTPNRIAPILMKTFMYMCLLVNANMLSTDYDKLPKNVEHISSSFFFIFLFLPVCDSPKVGEGVASSVFGTAVKLDLIFKRGSSKKIK